MKKKALAAAVLASMALTASTAFAEEAANPFTDIPADHWAYDACKMLQDDGVLLGYSDGTFQGDKLMNRYEMAEVVARAVERYDLARPADKGAIQKLSTEFADELKDMNVRLTNVENDVKEMKKGISSFKWFGDARVRHFWNKSGENVNGLHYGLSKGSYNSGMGKEDDRENNELRLRLGFYGEPAENLSVNGRLKVEDGNIARDRWTHGGYESWHSKEDEKVVLDRLQLDWHAKNGFTVSAGRNMVSIGQGLLFWENMIDSVMVQKDFGNKVSFLVGAGDSATSNWGKTAEFATFANLKVKASPAVEITAGWYGQHADKNAPAGGSLDYNNGMITWDKGATFEALKNYYSKGTANFAATRRDMGFLSLGVNAQLAPKWNVVVEGTHNTANPERYYGQYVDAANVKGQNNNKNGFWTRVTYGHQNWSKAGTWQVYGEYFALGGLAIDSRAWPHRLNISGGNGYGGAGARGWGLGVSYMLAANTNLELTYYDLKPYSNNDAGFDSYDKIGYAALSYSF